MAPGWTLADYAAAYAGGASVTEVITAVLDRLDELDDPAVLIGAPLRTGALAQAARLDALAPDAPARHGEMFGVPVAVKDNIDVAGERTTAACPDFAYDAEVHATAVRALVEAGAVIVAKTNMDQFATGLVGTRSPHGTPRNLFDPTLVPGGSSSGSAILVGRGLVPIALGTDTAGSGRVPAALNHVVGLKPTYGRIGTAGVVPAVRRADCLSVFALTVGDAAAAARVMTPVTDPSARLPRWRPGPRTSVRIGVPTDLELSIGARHQLAVAAALLAKLGAELVDVEFTALLEAGDLLYGPLVAERTAVIGDVLRRAASANPHVRSIVLEGDRYTAVDAYRTEYELAELRRRFVDLCAPIDCLLLPTISRPVSLAEVEAQPIAANHSLGQFTTFTNLLDACAVAVPVGVEDGLPQSVQLVGPAWADIVVEQIAAELQEVAGGPLGATGRPQPTEPPAGTRLSGTAIVVVGAHLTGQPLNHQLTSRGGCLVAKTMTAPRYRLHALDTQPPKPGLVRVAGGGSAISVEVWALDEPGFGSFVAEVPAPLCIGTVELADGSWCKGFLVEPWAVAGAPDITSFGGWVPYLASRSERH